jgi:hypothetical protein
MVVKDLKNPELRALQRDLEKENCPEKTGLQSLRLQRARDYVNLFGLVPGNAVWLDSVIHKKEYD